MFSRRRRGSSLQPGRHGLLRIVRAAEAPQHDAETDEPATRATRAETVVHDTSGRRRLRIHITTAPTAPMTSADGQIRTAIRKAATWMP